MNNDKKWRYLRARLILAEEYNHEEDSKMIMEAMKMIKEEEIKQCTDENN